MIGVASTAFADPATASGFLSTYGVLGLVIMYLGANIGLVVNWARLRRRGERKLWLWVVVPLIGIVVLAMPLLVHAAPRPAVPVCNILPWLTLGLIAVGIIYQYVLGKLRPDALANAGVPRRRAQRDTRRVRLHMAASCRRPVEPLPAPVAAGHRRSLRPWRRVGRAFCATSLSTGPVAATA